MSEAFVKQQHRIGYDLPKPGRALANYHNFEEFWYIVSLYSIVVDNLLRALQKLPELTLYLPQDQAAAHQQLASGKG
jgi:hypothetical protein